MRAPARELFQDAAFPASDSSLFSSFSTPLAQFREDITWRRPQVGHGARAGSLDPACCPGASARAGLKRREGGRVSRGWALSGQQGLLLPSSGVGPRLPPRLLAPSQAHSGCAGP